MLNPLLIAALIYVESRGNNSAVGANGELGCLQITPAVVVDCNAAQDLVNFSLEDRLDRAKSVQMCEIYLAMYCTPERLGHPPTMQDYARTWNGGPLGARRDSTLAYWHVIQSALLTPGMPAMAGFNLYGPKEGPRHELAATSIPAPSKRGVGIAADSFNVAGSATLAGRETKMRAEAGDVVSFSPLSSGSILPTVEETNAPGGVSRKAKDSPLKAGIELPGAKLFAP